MRDLAESSIYGTIRQDFSICSGMRKLNYKQLQQFWTVAKAGSIKRASEQLHLTPQTLSGQIAALEESVGALLFKRAGRRLELTETGRLVRSYADEIFEIGGELEDALRSGKGVGRAPPFRVGITEVVPKSLAYQLLAPALTLPDAVRIVCREDKLGRLLAELMLHKLDLVLTDRPLSGDAEIKAFSHKLGECGSAFLATPALAARYRPGFPNSLVDAPLLAPGEDAAVRPRLMRWFEDLRIQPRIVGEFDDSALMKAFGAGGVGIFVVPTAVADEVQRIYGVELVGRTDDIPERFYAISIQRRITHPAVRAIGEMARTHLFAGFTPAAPPRSTVG